MIGWLRVAVAVGAVAMAPAVSPVPAFADVAALPTDAGVVIGSVTQTYDDVNDVWTDRVGLRYYRHVYGPNDLTVGNWWEEFVAPGGTEFPAPEYRNCQEITPRTHYRCGPAGGFLYVDNPNNAEVCCNPADMTLTIVGPITSPGKITLDYVNDTNPSNDTATLTLHVQPVGTSSSTPAPPATKAPTNTPSRSPEASRPAARPSLGAGSTGDATTPPTSVPVSAVPASGVAGADPTPTPANVRLASGTSHGSRALLWIAIGTVLVIAGGGGAFVVLRRRRVGGADPGP